MFIRRKRILHQGVIKDHTFPRPDHGVEHGFGKFGRRHGRPAQHDLNPATAGHRFRFDPWLVAREQDEQATLGAGMLDRDPQQCLDELIEDDLAGHRMRSLEHRPDIQLPDGRADGGDG
jgi:hypothetical protein